MKTILSISGGLGSAYALKLAQDKEGRENVDAVFADVKGTGYSHFWSERPEIETLLHERYGGETRDTYRFIWQIASLLDTPIERLEDGRSIWAVFGETRSFALMVGDKVLCKASEYLKRETIAQWIEARYEPGAYRMALGMGVFEGHRVYKAQGYWRKRLGWDVEVYSPIIEHFQKHRRVWDNCAIADWLNGVGIEAPEAYRQNYLHNNCSQQCVLAGQSQWAWLYKTAPVRYLYAADKERDIRRKLGIAATILSIERDGVKFPVTLYEFIAYIERDEVNEKDLGGSCSCFTSAFTAALLGNAAPKPRKPKRMKAL